MKLRIESLRTGREVTTSALVNSGYEAETPQLLVPRRLAAEPGLWPPPEDAQLLEYGIAGGPTRVYLIPQSVEVSVNASDRVVGPVKCDAVASPHKRYAWLTTRNSAPRPKRQVEVLRQKHSQNLHSIGFNNG